jgi:hypothetical protein
MSLALANCLSLAISNSARAATFDYTLSGATYTVVEADPFFSGGSPGNTVNMNDPGQFWAHTPTSAPFNADGLYRYRDFGGMWWNQPAGTAQSDPDVFEVSSQTGAPPDLRTTVTVPDGTYDVYLALLVEQPGVHAATLTADLDVGQAKPTTLRGPRTQQNMILTGQSVGGGGYEIAMAPLGTVSGTSIKVLVGPMWIGDLNDDYRIGQDDLNLVLSNFLQLVTPGDRSRGDTDGNGFITSSDITNVVYEAWGFGGYPPGRRGDYIGIAYKPSGGGAGGSVPEPSPFLLLAAAVISLVACRFRHRGTFAIASVWVLLTVAIAPPSALAGISGSFVQVTTEEGQSPPADYVSQDLTVNADTDWLGAQLRILLTADDKIYQNIDAGIPNPIFRGPNPANFGSLPSLRWDTYLTGSGGLSAAPPNSAGGAVDIGGTTNISTGGTFTDDTVNMQWYTTSTTDIGQFTLGRFTLHNTAQGTWLLRLDSKDQTAPFYVSGDVQSGLLVPDLLGDYNGDGKVDAADYVTWRKNPSAFFGSPTGYNVWRSNFGNPAGSGLGAGVVPEPGAISWLAGLVLVANICRTPLKRHSK